MNGQITPLESSRQRLGKRGWLLAILPLVALAGVIVLFVNTGGGLRLNGNVPVEAVSIERTILTPGHIAIQVRNASPKAVTLAQIVINDAVWPMSVHPSATIPRLGRATVHLDYPWVYGEAYAITLFTSSSIPFTVDIPVAIPSARANSATLLSFTLIGIYVGVIPVYLGLFWYPILRLLKKRGMAFLLAITAGLLIFLGVDTLSEALEQSGSVPGPLQGVGLAGIGAIGTFMLLNAIARRGEASRRSETAQRMALASMIAVGIGLHNLGEGLAIGAAYNVGQIALGTFLVVGFIIQNITEGLGIIAPVLRDQPGVKNLAILGMIGGGPAILGAWIGGFAPSHVLAVLFLGIGSGAVFEVVYEIGRMIQRDTRREAMPLTIFSGVVLGMLALWVTGLMIK